MDIVSALTDKINKARDLDFGTIFNESIELFKKTWLHGLLLQIFSILVMLPLIIVYFIPFIGAVIAQQEGGYVDNDAMENFLAGMSLLYILFVFVGAIVLGSVSYALNAGFYRIMKKLDHNEEVTTKEFFYFVKGKYLGKLLVLMVVIILIAIPSALLCYIPLIYVMVPMSFFLMIFAFNPELSVGQLVSVSFKLGNKKWLITFGLLVVTYLLSVILTFVTCGIGGLFLAPFMYHPIYLIYKHVIGFDDTNVIDQIGLIEE
ncbi:hypothetical protein [Seonamhaeicola marinus]|uniref:DUF975 family protein n=1 Tax=Seonamhaeicola marinus TaxID=1912246 RepID=A0A5D0HZG8_9FLAO|nr:hypothetical protein [Seonamhaeicola marinus]TYA74892.1 hypothetical protein FUA24_16445 [Seonamhaeicola marinus]